jgi:exosortase/archaeosortase family protein
MTRSRTAIAGAMFACGFASLIADRDQATQAFAGRITGLLAAAHAEATVQLLRETGIADAQHDGRVVRDHRFAYEIDTGCLNLPLIALPVIAVAMSPASLLRRGLGVAAAVLSLAGLNFLRLVHLFHLGAYDPAAFQRAHDIGWPMALVVSVLDRKAQVTALSQQ